MHGKASDIEFSITIRDDSIVKFKNLND